MRIGEMAERTGVPAKTIRYYESIGLLPAVPREDSGYRVYSESEAKRLRFIAQGKALGLSLEEIGDILKVSAPDAVNCDHVLTLLETKRDALDARIREAIALRDALGHTIAVSRERLHEESREAFHCPVIERGLHERGLHLSGVAHEPGIGGGA